MPESTLWLSGRLTMSRSQLARLGMAALLLLCLAAAAWTAYWSLRFGLARRTQLSSFQVALRLAIIAIALTLVGKRRDRLVRTALLLAVLAAGSSALYGFGVTAAWVRFSRLLFHFLAYALGAIVIARWLRARPATEGFRSKG